MANNGNKQYLSAMFGANTKGPYIFHAEGNVARTPVYHPAEGDKKSFLSMSAGIGRNAWEFLGEDAVKSHTETTFVSLSAFGELADAIHDAVDVGSKILFCGRPEINEYTTKDGKPGASVRVYLDGFQALSCRTTKGSKPNRRLPHTTRVYKTREGNDGKEALACLLTGTVKKVEPLRDANGRQSINFSMDVEMAAKSMADIVAGTWNKETKYGDYRTVRCTVWGPRAARLGSVLTVGNELAITGSPSVREYNGNEYVNLSVRELSVLNWVTPAAPKGQNAAAAPAAAKPETPPQSAPEDDAGASGYNFLEDDGGDDLELPF